MRKLAAIPALVAAIFSMDLHWSVMQAVTWVAMIQESGTTASFGEKVVSTITGEAPCDRCRALAEQRQSQRGELFALFGKGPQLAPLDLSATAISHHAEPLFQLHSPWLLPESWYPPSIERPPCA